MNYTLKAVNERNEFGIGRPVDDCVITVAFNAETVDTVCDNFKTFLLACGYQPDSIAAAFNELEEDDELPESEE